MPNITEIEKWFSRVGSTYRFGGSCNCSASNCNGADCSEMVKWVFCKAGVNFPDGTWLQYRYIRNKGLACSVDTALSTFGALLFSFSSSPLVGGRPSQAHVAISIGNGRTFECRSTAHGCGYFNRRGGWTHAGLAPGFDYRTVSRSFPGSSTTPGAPNPALPTISAPPPEPPPTPPSPPPPPPPAIPPQPDWIANLTASSGCRPDIGARVIRSPYGDGSIWLINAFFRHRVTSSAHLGILRENGYPLLPASVTRAVFDSLIDVTDW